MSGTWDAVIRDEPKCPYCNGHGWLQLSFDPDVDIDCPMCVRRPQ